MIPSSWGARRETTLSSVNAVTRKIWVFYSPRKVRVEAGKRTTISGVLPEYCKHENHLAKGEARRITRGMHCPPGRKLPHL